MVLPTTYMGSVEWYRQFLANPSAVQIEVMESFPKQTYRNRCTITMPIGDKAKGEKQNTENPLPFREGMGVGSLTLTVPVKRADSKQLTRDVEISYQQRWQHQHWIALVSAYKRIADAYEFKSMKIGEPYVFEMDYYWMMGDNRHKSADSRYWGFVPEDHIVGRPMFVWLSIEKDNPWGKGHIRWNRIGLSNFE